VVQLRIEEAREIRSGRRFLCKFFCLMGYSVLNDILADNRVRFLHRSSSPREKLGKPLNCYSIAVHIYSTHKDICCQVVFRLDNQIRGLGTRTMNVQVRSITSVALNSVRVSPYQK
jgi:hypothetical protein